MSAFHFYECGILTHQNVHLYCGAFESMEACSMRMDIVWRNYMLHYTELHNKLPLQPDRYIVCMEGINERMREDDPIV